MQKKSFNTVCSAIFKTLKQKQLLYAEKCQLLEKYELTVTFGFTARKSREFSSKVRNFRETLKAYLL